MGLFSLGTGVSFLANSLDRSIQAQQDVVKLIESGQCKGGRRRGAAGNGEVSWALGPQEIAGRLGVGVGKDPILALPLLRLGCLSKELG